VETAGWTIAAGATSPGRVSAKAPEMTVETIKTATKAAIAAIGGVDAAETITRVRRSVLSDYGNRNSPHVVPVDVAIDLDRCAQTPLILQAMALAEGYTLLPIEVGKGCVAASMSAIAENAGRTISTALMAIADGVITREEADAMLRELADLLRVVQHAQAAVMGERDRVAPLPATLRGN